MSAMKATGAMIAALAVSCIISTLVEARPSSNLNQAVESVIQSPNADLTLAFDSQRNNAPASVAFTQSSSSSSNAFTKRSFAPVEPAQMQAEARLEPSSDESPLTPVYASPFVRSADSIISGGYPLRFENSQESSQAPPNYAPRPTGGAFGNQPVGAGSSDLKTSASYGHHHHGGHHGHHGYGYGPSGWLDMGAWTGGKGSFGWYADYPVGGKHHYGYGRK